MLTTIELSYQDTNAISEITKLLSEYAHHTDYDICDTISVYIDPDGYYHQSKTKMFIIHNNDAYCRIRLGRY